MRQAQVRPGYRRRNDDDWWSRARNRDEAAIRAIMKANNQRLYRIARGIVRNDSEAEDVVQEAYVRAFTHLEHFAAIRVSAPGCPASS